MTSQRMHSFHFGGAQRACAAALLALLVAPGCIAWKNPLSSASLDPASNQWSHRDDYWFPEPLSTEKIERNVATVFGGGPNEEVALAAFDEGRRLMKEEKFALAAAQFKRAARRWPDSGLEEDALFWRAEAKFFQDRYADAAARYDSLLAKFPNSRHLDVVSERRFAMGDHWMQRHDEHGRWPIVPNVLEKEEPLFDTKGRAINLYESIVETDSTGPLADDALMRMANAYFTSQRYDDAVDYYDMLRRQFPKSPHQFDALRLAVQCELRRYEGPRYDGQALDRAEQYHEQLLVQFPDRIQETAGEEERLQQIGSVIKSEIARRDLETADYYDRRKYYGSARLYYEDLATEHAGTPVADDARRRLQEIAEFPAQPPTLGERVASLVPWNRPAAAATGDDGDLDSVPGDSGGTILR